MHQPCMVGVLAGQCAASMLIVCHRSVTSKCTCYGAPAGCALQQPPQCLARTRDVPSAAQSKSLSLSLNGRGRGHAVLGNETGQASAAGSTN